MADPVKRLNYFDKQFLREQDFIDEQNYHIQRQRDHNRLMHTPGIAQGLEIPDPPAGSTRVTVNAGIADDHQGREIVLANNQEINLESLPDNQSVYIAIAYAEQETDPKNEAGVTGNTRWTEAPAIETLEPDTNGQFPADPEEKIILAKVNRNGNQINTIDRTERRAAGVVGGDLEVRSLTLTNPTVVSNQWVRLNLSAAQQVDMNGNLNVTGTIAGNLANGIVGTAALANNSVTTIKIVDNAVTLDKLEASVQSAIKAPITSVDGVSNPSGNIDLIPNNAITISPNNTANSITIGENHSARTNNPHQVTAAQVGAFPNTGGEMTGVAPGEGMLEVYTTSRFGIIGQVRSELGGRIYGSVSNVGVAGYSLVNGGIGVYASASSIVQNSFICRTKGRWRSSTRYPGNSTRSQLSLCHCQRGWHRRNYSA